MNDVPNATRFVGQRIPRKEDRRLLTGHGAFTDDVPIAGALEACFVRSPIAKGRIVRVDAAAARQMPGVHAIYTVADFEPLNAVVAAAGGQGVNQPRMGLLAIDDVRFVGDPVAIVVADNRYLAEDAANAVLVDYESEDAVVTIAQARVGAPAHRELDNNLGVGARSADDDPELDALFAKAAHVVSHTINHRRLTHAPMEGRAVASVPTGAGELTVYVSCQSPQQMARFISEAFNLPNANVRAIAKDVGGAFGQKISPGREELSVIAASLMLRRPVKWAEDRLESLTCAYTGREQEAHFKMAFDADARILGGHIELHSNVGAYPAGIHANALVTTLFPGPYRVARNGFKSEVWYSNTTGLAAYRGPWAMESLARETLLDVAARQIGIAPEEIRARNLITREDQPYRMCTGPVLDHVTPRETLALALKKIDVAAFREEQAEARKKGRYIGLGMAVYVEPTTMATAGVLSSETAYVRIEPTGKVIAMMSTHSQGHGTETTMAQVIADSLGVPFADVSVVEGDSSRGGFGAGAGGSRQAVLGGGSARLACQKLLEKLKLVAAHVMNSQPEFLEVADGKISVRGEPEVFQTVKQIAQIAYLTPSRMPPGLELGLESQARYRPDTPIIFSNASHACTVEVDVETGLVKILRWVAVEDCGAIINPSVVEGQIAGGVVQGIGEVLMEDMAYDDLGNPRAATFKDYLTPTIHDVPLIEYDHLETPAKNEGGFKGVGEGGAIIGPPTLVNAIADALAPFGVELTQIPLSPDYLLKLLEGRTPAHAG